jgi:hypothetical protein
LKAIQTEYKGYRFRSRLEARWAVFFDALGVTWEYEPEGFDLGNNRWYLPDFRVTSPHGNITWYEVKPSQNHDDGKMDALKNAHAESRAGLKTEDTTRFFVLSGDPLDHMGDEPHQCVCPRCGLIDTDFDSNVDYYFCYPCDITTPCGGDNPAEKCLADKVFVYPHKGAMMFHDPYSLDNWSAHVWTAAKKARAARFEHGERP